MSGWMGGVGEWVWVGVCLCINAVEKCVKCISWTFSHKLLWISF